MSFSETAEFARELKRLSKSHRSLRADLEKFKQVIGCPENLEEIHFFDGPNATKLRVGDGFEVVKARLDCADLGNKQLLRVIYIRRGMDFVLIELYAKNEQSREDAALIRRELKG